MKIVFVNGSPRPNGNTGTMLRTLARKAEERGVDITYFEIVENDVHDCDGCYRCNTEEVCSQDDDMRMLYGLIEQADVLVIGSPIYMGMETGLTKCFLDRLYYLMARKSIQPGRKAAALFTCGTMDGHVVYGYMNVRYTKLLHKDLGFDDVRTFIVPGTKNEVNVDDNYYAQETLKELEQFIFPEV